MPRGKKQPTTIGSFEFPTQAAAIEYMRSLLNGLPQRTRIHEPFDSILRDVLFMHPRSAEKVKGVISHFTIEPVGVGASRSICFHLYRTDGSKTDFSFYKCLRGEKADDLANGALREAIDDHVRAFRDARFAKGENICQLTGERLIMGACHVDHAPPNTFYNLVQSWLAREDMKLSDVNISGSRDNQIYREMLSHEQKKSWAQFHRENAVLRLTTVQGNLSLSKLELSGKL